MHTHNGCQVAFDHCLLVFPDDWYFVHVCPSYFELDSLRELTSCN